jgi:hypothetical protein
MKTFLVGRPRRNPSLSPGFQGGFDRLQGAPEAG